MKIMEWLLILELVAKIILECRDEGVDEETIKRRARDGLFKAMIMRRAVRQQTGLNGLALRRAIKEAMDKLNDIPQKEIDMFVEGCCAEFEPVDYDRMVNGDA